jgi:two-component sensor histidine kinase
LDDWIKALRAQSRKIAQGAYRVDPDAFKGAPEAIRLLSMDLDALALAMAQRDAAQAALTHEVHHRVKNNLQIVTSLLNLQASKIKDAKARRPLDQARVRMGALALIHRLLYEQDDDSVRGSVNLARLMSELGAQLRVAHRSAGGIDFASDASPYAVPIDHAVPLTLFAVEAVTNAYHHAFPKSLSGTVTLHFSVAGDSGLLRITDDGVGFDAQSDSGSMGRQLMNGFAHQLGGTLTIESATAAGTVVTLIYPLTAR